MSEHPILFSSPMIRALLAGTKTQTRRIVNPQLTLGEHGWAWPSSKCRPMVSIEEMPSLGPHGGRRDRLWVRETHAQFAVGNRTGTSPQCVAYRATCDDDGGFDYVNNGDEIMRLKVTKWTPSIFMPRWASRITLEITDVRVQRLQEISEDDARAEGVAVGEMQDMIINGEPGRAMIFRARDAFAYLWNAINGRRAAWASNPFVWAYTFRRIS